MIIDGSLFLQADDFLKMANRILNASGYLGFLERQGAQQGNRFVPPRDAA